MEASGHSFESTNHPNADVAEAVCALGDITLNSPALTPNHFAIRRWPLTSVGGE
jgi:hypothetical protein